MNVYNIQPEKRPYLGFGLGLRTQHYEDILNYLPDIDWFEIISENYLIPGGKPVYYLHKIREHYPMVMHGVSLSLGSSDPIQWDYLKQVKELASRIEPVWISDHLCWTGVNGLNMHDLLPVPYTKEIILHIVSRLTQIQDYLKKPFLIENVSSYLGYKQSEMTEWEFITSILRQSGCYMLLDVNNVYVSAVNHGFDPMDYLNALPPEKIIQIHLAGHSNCGNYLIDTHDASVIDPVWELYEKAVQRFGSVSTMIERDNNIPPLADLLTELGRAREIASLAMQELCYD
ncbi:DUF692 domain-containing protein [Legionella sp. 16cNR16C]|uniref:MNIO family bufferin maturase n=1 Tax=Legionella sp. 16cNR16C TaxID=2905656 RepID=UPI001E41140F|nr:DUF692 domain-containing protein [Legionella sp. 16cNR16C]MCE3043549.1 DUF692 domain-containing protein [Legionella sp. 16cNR16C]